MSAPDELISLRYSSFRDFIESSSGRLSAEGMFVETDRPRPVGSPVSFELTVGHDFMLFRGTGEVAWARDAATARGGAPGMAIRFEEVAYPGRRLLEKVVRKYEEDGVGAFALVAIAATTTDLDVAPAEEAPSPSSRETTLEEFLRQDTPRTDGPAAGVDLFAGQGFDEASPEGDPGAADLLATESAPPETLMPDRAVPNPYEGLPVELPEEPVSDEPAGTDPAEAAADTTDAPRLTLEDLMAAASESARESDEAEWVPPSEPEPPAEETELQEVELPVFQAPLPHEYRSGLSAEDLAGSQSTEGSARGRRPGGWIVILSLLLVACAAAWLFRGRLVGLFTGGESASATAAIEEPAADSAAEPPVSPDVATGDASAGQTDDPTGAAGAADVLAAQPPVDETREGVSVGGDAAGAPVVDSAYTGVDDITWREENGTTVIVVQADARVQERTVSNFRIDEGRPREVIEIAGTRRSFTGGTVTIDGRHVLRIRTGYRSEDGGVLRLVADLTGPEIRLQSIAVAGAEILITLAPPSAG